MSDKTFNPVFGPNGAVMNSPSMTPSLRSDYSEEAKPSVSLVRAFLFPAILLVLIAIQLILQPPIPVSGGVIAGFLFIVLMAKTRKLRSDR